MAAITWGAAPPRRAPIASPFCVFLSAAVAPASSCRNSRKIGPRSPDSRSVRAALRCAASAYASSPSPFARDESTGEGLGAVRPGNFRSQRGSQPGRPGRPRTCVRNGRFAGVVGPIYSDPPPPRTPGR